MSREEILQERLNRVKSIVDVMEQHGEVDATFLVQLRLALAWEPSIVSESQVFGMDCRDGSCEF